MIYILKHWFPLIKADDPEAPHLEKILDMWVSFATNGNPNDKSIKSHVSDVDWTVYDSSLENYLEIGEDLVMKKELFLERYRVWESIFPMAYP